MNARIPHHLPTPAALAPSRSGLLRKGVVVASLLAMQAQWMSPVMAAMSQRPLLSTVDVVAPNIVLTLDNSESMGLNHMPEDYAELNDERVYLGGTKLILMHPSDVPSANSFRLIDTRSAGYVTGTSGADCTETMLYECQMRSSDVNTVYYNPQVRYLPWSYWDETNKAVARMPSASFASAPIQPGSTTKVNLGDVKSVTANWCTSGWTCRREARLFNPAVFYILTSESANPNQAGSYLKFDLNQNDRSAFPWGNGGQRKDCAGASCTLAEERQNFANWFTYHRSRFLFTKGAISEAFAAQSDNIRLGWGSTSNAGKANEVDGRETFAGPVQGVRTFDLTHKGTFLTWLHAINVGGSTPLRFATTGVGRYFERTDAGSPWRTDPGVSNSPILGCRRAAHIMTTDGYYNDDGGMGGNYGSSDARFRVDEVDGVAATINGQAYTPTPPYADVNNSGSLADIAMRFYAFPLVPKNLQENMASEVDPTENDDATWLHLNQYMVGLGVKGAIDREKVHTEITTDKGWPKISTENTDKSKIDDMFHAALNSRGKYFDATEGSSLRQAIEDAVSQAQSPERRESGVAMTGRIVTVGATVFAPIYSADGWYGDVLAYTYAAGANGVPTLDLSKPTWRASEKVPGHESRNIITANADGLLGVPFNLAQDEQKNAVVPSTYGDAIDASFRTPNFIRYIRGDDSLEGLDFRARKKGQPLPDFVNSMPLLIGGNLDMGYELRGLPGAKGTYDAYVKAKAARDPLLFVGGNGGMLHAFDASTGAEIFAYVPRAALPNLHVLAQKSYGHQFFVDGALTEADAFIRTPSRTEAAWTNILIGTMGAGGRGIFALDVTGAARNGETTPLGAANVLWDITGTDNEDMGYITNRVSVGHVPGQGWFAFVGNGHDAPSGKGALLVIDLEERKIVRTIHVSPSPTVTDGRSNGLSGISLIRSETNEVIGGYAGDLHGQLWRFNFQGPPSTWTVDATPLIRAERDGEVQPISAAPTHTGVAATRAVSDLFVVNPDAADKQTKLSGYLVSFGTGKLVTEGDLTDQRIQTFYTVLDGKVTETSTQEPPPRPSPLTRSNLLQQTFEKSLAGNPLIQVSNNKANYQGEGAARHYGWYIDLHFTSENAPHLANSGKTQSPKVIYQPQIINNLVYFNAIVPPNPGGQGCDSANGETYTFLLPIFNGGQLPTPTWDSNGDGVIDGKDLQGQGYWDPSAVGDGLQSGTDSDRVNIDNKLDPQKGYDPCVAGGAACEDDKGPQITDRVWKRIIHPPF